MVFGSWFMVTSWFISWFSAVAFFLFLLDLPSLFCWRGANGLCLLEGYFWQSRLAFADWRDGSCWVILVCWLAQWAGSCCGVVFLNNICFGVRNCGFICSLVVGLLSGDVLSWHLLFCNVVLLVHSCRPRIVVVASVFGGASWLRALLLIVLRHLILVKVGCFLCLNC